MPSGITLTLGGYFSKTHSHTLLLKAAEKASVCVVINPAAAQADATEPLQRYAY